MSKGVPQKLKHLIRALPQIVWNLTLIALGSALCAVALNGILIPRQFLSGGFTGLSLIVHYLFPAFPVGTIYFLLNIPNFAFGWKYVGRRFFLYSGAGMVIFSAAIQTIHISLPVYDYLLSALLAGVIVGVGSGIILKSLGSAGGTDILSVILLKLFSLRLGTTILAFNGIILLAAAVLFTLEMALYTLIYLYISSYMVNLVVTGLNQRKAVYIISPQWKEISQEIIEELQRGVTILKGEGGFTGKDQHVLYTVITFRELSRLKVLIRRLDPDAFVVVTETLEVMGHRIGNQPHW
jgi:uncharacterized membrane-anchored protein YitT (DUF2179 family)